MAAVRGQMIEPVLENLDLDEDIEISSNISIDEGKPGLIVQEDDILYFDKESCVRY